MKFVKFSFLPALLLVLAACGTQTSGLNPSQEEAAASQAVSDAILEAFAASAATDGVDLGDASNAGLSAQSVEPFIVINRTRMHRSHELLTITIDLTTQPPTAVAEVALNISGVAQLWKIYPDLSAPRELVGEKEIDMNGTAIVTAERVPNNDGRTRRDRDNWRIVSVEHSGFSQGEYAAEITEWSVNPDPLEPGSDQNMVSATLDEPETSDEFLVVARGHHLHPKGVLNDNGEDPDPTADDDMYNGYIEVHVDARPGRHLGFLTALNYTRTIDLTDDGQGGFLYPYTDTLLPVVAVVDTSE